MEGLLAKYHRKLILSLHTQDRGSLELKGKSQLCYSISRQQVLVVCVSLPAVREVNQTSGIVDTVQTRSQVYVFRGQAVFYHGKVHSLAEPYSKFQNGLLAKREGPKAAHNMRVLGDT